MGSVLRVIGVESRRPDVPVRAVEQRHEAAVAEFDRLIGSSRTWPNERSASFNWRKMWEAAWAISVCIASSFSSFLPNVCGR